MKIVISVASSIALGLLSSPATAGDLDRHAETVVNGSALLKKAENNCGLSSVVRGKDALTLTFARATVEQAVPLSKLAALDEAADAKATSAAQDAAFCADTKRQKPALVSRIKKAAQAIRKQKAKS